MNYTQLGFRAFYKHFVIVPISDSIMDMLEDFPEKDKAFGVLTYGYYDREEGLSLEMLGFVSNDNGRSWVESPSQNIRFTFRIGSVENEECIFLGDEDGGLAAQFKDHLAIINEAYEVDREIEMTRKMVFLDQCRHQYFMDDILVRLEKPNMIAEGCWVRITGLSGMFFFGTLLNEPETNFGVHRGDEIRFIAQETKEKQVVCLMDLDDREKHTLTSEDLEDGQILDEAIEAFVCNRSKDYLLYLLEILRDSKVWVLCKAKDEENPEIMENEEGSFLPVFSKKEYLDDYGDEFTREHFSLLDVINMARLNEKELSSIIVNPFADAFFVLSKELWKLVESLQSRLS